ncbi:MAG: C39 family peptidase [Patescibacteria group bacterium]|jgi:hypothetical protein
MKTRRALTEVIIFLIFVAALAYIFRVDISNLWKEWMAEPTPEPITYEEVVNRRTNQNANLNSNSNTNTNVNSAPEPEVEIPAEFNLTVPFTTQSPFAEWNEQDEESCEEAASLIVHFYWQHKTFTKDIAKEELQKIVDYENETLGFYKDTTAEQTAEVIRGLWGYKKVEVKYGITIEDIKTELAQGRPVILPTAGRMLGNPNFKSPGPLYHMIVVRGWTKEMIITNDPGTRKGEQYQYSPDVLYNAIHDWNSGDVDNGQKAMIVVWPNE